MGSGHIGGHLRGDAVMALAAHETGSAPRRPAPSRALAELVDSQLSADPAAISDRTEAANAAMGEFRSSFVGTPYRPTGPTGPPEALAFLVDELDWLLSFALPPRGRIGAAIGSVS